MRKLSSGLNIQLGNATSKVAFEHAKSTYHIREDRHGAIGKQTDGAFSNILLFGDERIGIASDGVGTKIELAERTGIFDTIGFDLVAMVADDLVTAGFEPSNITNVIDVNIIDQSIINRMMSGFAQACTVAGMAITGGEIAELGSRVGGYGTSMHVNWSATAIGYLSEKRSLIKGLDIQKDEVVISLKSDGFRSNGFSLIRTIMNDTYGEDWHEAAYDDATTWGEKLLVPSLIYTPLINELLEEGLPITGIAHITGGGIEDNFSRALSASGKGAVLDNLFQPLGVMQRIQALGQVSNEDAYTYWNMGNGMLMTVHRDYAERILEKAQELGYQACVAGRITDSGTIQLENLPSV